MMRSQTAYIVTKLIRDQNAVGGSAATRYDPQALLELVDQKAAIRDRFSLITWSYQVVWLVTHDADLISFMDCYLRASH